MNEVNCQKSWYIKHEHVKYFVYKSVHFVFLIVMWFTRGVPKGFLIVGEPSDLALWCRGKENIQQHIGIGNRTTYKFQI